MPFHSTRLFSIAGFEVKLDASWFFIAVLLVWTLYSEIFPQSAQGLDGATYMAMAVVGTLAFFAGVVLHELAHSLVARAFGLEMGGITLFVFGGVAELPEEPRSAVSEFWIAIAGPIASFTIAAACWGAARGFGALPIEPPARAVLDYLAQVNVAMALFNLVPAFPLDGGRILRSVIWRATGNVTRATTVAAWAGYVFAWVLMGGGAYLLLVAGDAGGLWLVLIGLFLLSAAQSSLAQTLLRERLFGRQVRNAMSRDPLVTAPDVRVETLVRDAMEGRGVSFLPVVSEGRLVGTVDAARLKQAPADATVGDVMAPVAEGSALGPEMPAYDALDRMARTGQRKMVVAENGRVVGVLTLADLIDYVRMVQEIGAAKHVPKAGRKLLGSLS